LKIAVIVFGFNFQNSVLCLTRKLLTSYGEIIAKDYISAFIEFFWIKIKLKVKRFAFRPSVRPSVCPAD